MDDASAAYRFFAALFSSSVKVVEGLPLTVAPPPMDYILDVLEPEVGRSSAVSPFSNPPAEVVQVQGEAVRNATAARRRAIGLNTTGMLLDRLSILAVKHWNLIHRAGQPAKAELLVATQVEELVWALATALPGQSSINNKMTTHQAGIGAVDFAASYHGLLTTNALLWEAQELLYNHDIASLPDAELRAYIQFFSRGNLQRNDYIQAADQAYWRPVEALDERS